MIVVDLEFQKAILPLVTSKEIYVNGNTEKFHPEGIYSEKIFGTKNAWKCSCGAIEGSSYDGETCEICEVTCSDGTQRSKQFAKIKLTKKVLWPMFRKHLQALFGIKSIKDIFNPSKYQQNLEDPYFYDLMHGTLRKAKAIKGLDNTVFSSMPVYDIASLNALFDYIRADKILKEMVAKVINKDYIDYVFIDEIVVTPPSSRPVITTGNKKDIPDISKHYQRLLSLSTNTFWENPTKKEEEFNRNIYYYQKIVDELEQYTYDKNFLSKNSTIREAFSGSTVEFSSRTVIVPAPELPPYGVAVPKDAMLKMTMLNFLHFLVKEMDILKTDFDSIYPNVDVQQMIQMVRAGNTSFPVEDSLFIQYLQSKYVNQRIMIERAPVLWRYNFSGALITVILFEQDGYKDFKLFVDDKNYKGPPLSNTSMYNNKVMMVNTTVAGAFNFDFDGDSMSSYALDSVQALRDWYHTFLGNGKNIEFEHNNSLIPTPEHEAIYAMWALTQASAGFNTETIIEDFTNGSAKGIELKDFKYNFKTINENPMKPVYIKISDTQTIVLPYNLACINRALGFNIFLANPGEMNKNATKKLIKQILRILGNDNFYGPFHELNKFLLWCSTAVKYCNPTFDLKDFAVGSKEISNYKETLINEPYIGFHQNEILFSDYVKPEIAKNPENSLHRVFKSDARIKSVQLLKASSNSGIPTNIHGKAFINNIKEDLLYGHTKEGFFQSGDSARLALAQRQEAIPKGGELQRRFYYILGFLKLSRTEDCSSKQVFPIEIQDKNHLDSLNGRYYIQNNKKLHLNTEEINPEDFIGKTFNFRYPGGCEHPGYKICNTCFGTRQPQSANLGAAVGSYISESIIQSVLRTHHFSGAFITNIRKPILELIKRNRFESPDIIYFKLENVNEDFKILRAFYDEVYPNPEDVELNFDPFLNTETEIAVRIKVVNAPYNDDSVKKLNNIIQIIDKDRTKEKLMQPSEMYKRLLDEIILPNGILSIYVELVMSILFFDENGVMCRYGGEPDHQIALKNIIKNCDPRLAIYYNFNPTAVAQILKDSGKVLGAEHMYSDALKLFDK